MTRIGIIKPDHMHFREMMPYLKMSDELGYTSFWFSEDCYFTDAVSPAGAAALMFEKPKIGLGVLNYYTRSPALIAMTTATLDDITKNRLLLGIGTSIGDWMAQQGIKFERNLTAMREAVEIIRRLLAGENLTYKGSVFNIQGVKLSIKPPRDKVPIYVAAMGPKMCQLAGEIGDGVHLSIGTPLAYMSTVLQNIEIGAKRAGRNATEIDVVGYINISVSKDAKKAKDAVRPIIAFEVTFDIFAPLLNAAGIDFESLAPIRKALAEGNMAKALSGVTDEMVDFFAIAGTSDECKEKLEKFRKAGMKEPIIYPMGDVKAAIEAAAP